MFENPLSQNENKEASIALQRWQWPQEATILCFNLHSDEMKITSKPHNGNKETRKGKFQPFRTYEIVKPHLWNLGLGTFSPIYYSISVKYLSNEFLNVWA